MEANNENLSDEDRELIKHYEAAIAHGRLDYFDVDEMEIIIEHYLFDGDPRDAQRALDYAFRLHPGDRYLQCQKAALLLRDGKLREALQLLEIYRDKNDPVHSFNRAEILYRLGRKREAIAVFRDLVNNNDENNDTPGLCLDIINLINSRQDFAESLYFFDKGLALNPNDLDLLETKGMTLENLDRKSEAIALYNHVLDVDPYRMSAWYMLGSLYFDDDKYREALTAYDYVLAIEPNDTLALSQKAFCQFNIDDIHGAVESCKKYLETTPDDDGMIALLGECYESLEQPAEAQRCYQKSVTLNPQNNAAWFGLGVTQLTLGETEKAKQTIKKAISLKPDALENFMLLVDILIEEGNPAEAINVLLHIVQNIDNTKPYTWKRLGDAYLDVDASDKAQKAYERAMQLCSMHETEIEGLPLLAAIASYYNADYASAQRYYDQAKRLDTSAREMLLRVFPKAGKHLAL